MDESKLGYYIPELVDRREQSLAKRIAELEVVIKRRDEMLRTAATYLESANFGFAKQIREELKKGR